ncbi:MAG: response regulator transcription factor [Blautia sp.]|nr:response regulator transcription factor [Blautia sp.]
MVSERIAGVASVKIALVDDEQEMRVQLSEYVNKYGAENRREFQIVPFPSGDALLENYQPEFEVIIFDIDMPGTNGMDTARQVRAMDEHVVILFVTNIAQYAINGYEVEAVDYIIKPIGYYDFSMKFERALRRVVLKQVHQLVLESSEGPVRLNAEDILYVEVLGHYLVYHTTEKEHKVRGSMREAEETLRNYHFVRSHKSYLINLAQVKNIRASDVVAGGIPVPLGRAYKDSLSKEYLLYLRG